MGFPVAAADTPVGYDETETRGTTSSGTSTTLQGGGTKTTFSHPQSTQTSSHPPSSETTQQPPTPNKTSSGLQKGEIIGISLGAVSALAAVVGLWLRWRHLQVAKQNKDVTEDKL
ncbi:hypothetical protein B0T25DRAFT_518741 [Lasiosphaeria hispida]|uniref:Uncharacterized protein n=1 Tax=Lasiosphaeria hispida TaxID=260671 RepID=A0AAJ0HJA4_9PEZI|nr:hypothetical protein B0T25DRAFT_518741 [Lasiosphaeria hispida]